MYTRFKSFFFSGDRQFVTLRGVSMCVALTFALIYSKQLGVERRGLLTFVMMINLILSILLISGISLHLRNISRVHVDKNILGTYLAVVLLFSSIIPFITVSILNLYEITFDIYIPNNITYVCVLYSFFSTLNYGLYDALLLIKSTRIASVIDIGIVLLQIAIYLTLVYSGEVSYFVAILTSISFSYLVMASSVLLLLMHVYNPRISLSFEGIRQLLRDSSHPTLVHITSQLLERVDKVFIGIQINNADLGRYSTSQSIMGISKFVPDSVSKLTLVRNKNFLSRDKMRSRIVSYVLILSLALSLVATQLLKFILGDSWVLPFLLLTSLAFLELLRGVYSVVVTTGIHDGQFLRIKKVSQAQLILSFSLQPIAIYFAGLWGSCLTNILILTLSIIYLRDVFDA